MLFFSIVMEPSSQEKTTTVHRVEDVEIFPGAAAALKRLHFLDAGFQLFIVTNQSGIGRGMSSPSPTPKT